MKLMGIDYGSRNIGVAVSREGIAFARTTLKNDAGIFDALWEIVQKESVQHIVMGDTRSYNDRENPITVKAEQFAKRLEEVTQISVQLVREVGTSAVAREYAPDGHPHDDAAAAAIILQRYIDMSQTKNPCSK